MSGKRIASSLFVLIASCSDSAPATDGGLPAPGEGTWGIVFRDEFDAPAGVLPDASRWTLEVGGDGWGNQQLEFDTARAENASHDGFGHLAITAREENYQGRSYTSARMRMREEHAQAYGRIEARVRLPIGQGVWPAFWMLGANVDTVPWPECGEIDILEFRGQAPNVVQGSLHGPGYSGAMPVTEIYTREGAGFDQDFHIFAIEWDPGRIAWLIDGEVYQVRDPSSLLAGTSWVFDHAFFIILNVAIGGGYVGPPADDTPFPATMLVDYVRVYERN